MQSVLDQKYLFKYLDYNKGVFLLGNIKEVGGKEVFITRTGIILPITSDTTIIENTDNIEDLVCIPPHKLSEG